jgi:hypothetical protein
MLFFLFSFLIHLRAFLLHIVDNENLTWIAFA